MQFRRQRLVIVKRGALDLFERLRARFARDPDSTVIWDRRAGQERRTSVRPVAVDRRIGQRRYPDGSEGLAKREFFVVRLFRPEPADRRRR